MLLYYIKAFFRAIADFLASIGAKYVAYLERENAKVRAEAKANAERIRTDAVADEHTVHDRENEKAQIADHGGNDIFSQIGSLFCHSKFLRK